MPTRETRYRLKFRLPSSEGYSHESFCSTTDPKLLKLMGNFANLVLSEGKEVECSVSLLKCEGTELEGFFFTDTLTSLWTIRFNGSE